MVRANKCVCVDVVVGQVDCSSPSPPNINIQLHGPSIELSGKADFSSTGRIPTSIHATTTPRSPILLHPSSKQQSYALDDDGRIAVANLLPMCP